MKRTITSVGLLAACVTVLLSASVFVSGALGSAKGCSPGVKTINGVSARTFCGPATAKVKVNGKTITYKGGECSKSVGLFTVNIGTIVLGNLKNKPEYLGITAEAKVGVHSRQTIAVVHAGKSHAVIGTVRIKPGFHGGTFSGKEFGSSSVISGAFTC